jgi:4-hydroxy-tetrahydrodipicolinate synthase
MKSTHRISGVLAPVVTPFKMDLSPDPVLLIRHCKWLLTQNCGLALFGTNSEANSLSVDERIALLDDLLASDIDAARMMPGTGCCALPDTVRLTAHAVKAGCPGVLMLPPFYYKGVSEDGLYRSFSEVIERVGDTRLRIYLYHIPPITMVGITPDLVERLLKHYPTAIAGMKDSSGDWQNTKTMLDAFADECFDVFVGSESFLLANMQNGGVGCISATANVNPAAIDRLYRTWCRPDGELQQLSLNALRKTVEQFVMIPSLKAILAHYTGDVTWMSVRPPLTTLAKEQVTVLIERLQKISFDMPDIRTT